MEHLTKSQQKVYDFLRQKVSGGVPPTVREICAATGLRSTSTVHAHLKTLEAGKELFALHVSGLSMRDAGILDGDYVVAERVSTADDGEIVVAMIDDEATVKRLYREKEGVRLQPANPDFQPIYSDHASVLGKVIAVVRYY